MKKRVFIGSSIEAKNELERVGHWLEEADVDPVPWNEPGLFPLGGYMLPRLIEISTEVNGAILLFTPDDTTWYRGKSVLRPRDNVIFEYGLFVSRLGERAAVICRKGAQIASDLGGLIYLDISQQKRAKDELIKWAHQLPGNSAPRISLLGSTTEKISASEELTAALNEFYSQFIEDCNRFDLGINTCGSPPFLSAAYRFYYEKILKANRDREFAEHHKDRIRWYWHTGGKGGVNFCPPVFESRRTASIEDRLRREVDDSDLIVALAGRTGTVRQLDRILGDQSLNGREKRVVIVGWFGGLVHDFLKNLHRPSRRIIRSCNGIEFAEVKNQWHANPRALATELVKAIHHLILEQKQSSRKNT